MQALGCIAEIEKLIPSESRNTIVAALRQDSCVWNAINAPGFIEQLKARFSISEPNWSPANLSLIALEIQLDVRRLSTDMATPLDGLLRERAVQTYQATLLAPAPSGDLGDAGLVALAMREIKRKTPSWKDILDALRKTSPANALFDQDIWRTSLACIFGMIPDPIDFLAALLAGVPGDHAYNIVSHVILSNPLSLSQQSNIFLTLFERVGMSQQLIWLRHLNCIGRDELVNMIATQLIAEKKTAPVQAAGDGHQPREIEFEITHGLASQYLAALSHYSNQPEQALEHLLAARDSMKRWHSGLNVQLAEIAAVNERYDFVRDALRREDESQSSTNHLAPEFGLAISDLSIPKSDHEPNTQPGENPLMQLELAGALGREGRLEEACKVGREAVSRLLADFSRTGQAYHPKALLKWDPASGVKILIGLELFSEALQLVQVYLKDRPADRSLIDFAIYCLRKLGEERQALPYARLAALLDSGNLSNYRQLAEILETLAEWNAGFEVRKKIVELDGEPSQGDWLDYARCGINCGEIESAIHACTRILESNLTNGKANTLMGQALLEKGEQEQGVAFIKTAIENHPEEAEAWLTLADYHCRQGEQNLAMDMLHKAEITLPDSAEIHARLADLCQAEGALTQAQAHYQKAAMLAPDRADYQRQLGETLLSLGHVPEAKAVLVKAHNRWHTHSSIAYAAGKAHLESGELDQALLALDIAVKSEEPEFEWLLLFADSLLARIKSQATDLKPGIVPPLSDARWAVDAALLIQPDNFRALLLKAETMAAEGDFEPAFELFQLLATLPEAAQTNSFGRIQKGLGKSALDAQRFDIALAVLQEAVQAQPGDLDIQQYLAEAYLANGLRSEGYQAAAYALKLAPDDRKTLLWFAEKARQMGEIKEAIETLEYATQLEPGNPDTQLRLAEAQVEGGWITAARASLESFSSIADAGSDHHHAAAKLYLGMGDDQAALQRLEKAAIISERPKKELLIDLARQRERTDVVGALEAIQKACAYYPTDVDLLGYQAVLLAGTNRIPEAVQCWNRALECIMNAFPADPGEKHAENSWNPNLSETRSPVAGIHLRLSQLLRATGYLLQAHAHTEKALETNPGSTRTHLLAADISRALLDDTNQERYLQAAKNGEIDSEETQVTLACMLAEKALDKGQLDEAVKTLANVDEIAMKNPRYMAGKSRLLAQQGDHKLAQEWYQIAKSSYQEQLAAQSTKLVLSSSGSIEAAGEEIQPGAYWLAEAAQDVGALEDALNLSTEAATKYRNDPRAHLDLARRLAVCAGQQRLREEMGVTRHLPEKTALSEEAQRTFENAVRCARNLSGSDAILHWGVLGRALYKPDASLVRKLAGLKLASECIPWLVQASRLAGDCAGGIEAVKTGSDDSMVWLQIGLCYQSINPQKGLEYAQKSLERNPADPLLHAAVSRLAESGGNIQLALSEIQEALAVYPDEVEWQVLAARLASSCGLPDTARKHWEQAYYMLPERLDIGLSLGKVYLDHGAPKQAVEVLQRLCHLKPDSPELWSALAQAHQQLGSRRQALECAEKAANLDPESIQPYLDCVDFALSAGDNTAALGYAKKAIDRQPSIPEAHLSQARVYSLQGDLRKAREQLEQTPEDVKQSIPVLLERSRLTWKLEGAQAALPFVRDLASLASDQAEVMALLAQVLAEGGDSNGAAADAIQKSLRLNPEQPALNCLMGDIQHKSGQLDQAIHYFSEAIRQNPLEPTAFIDLAGVYLERREYTQALNTYHKAMAVCSDDPRPYLLAAQVLRECKDYPGAEELLRKAAELAPKDVNIRRQLGAIIALNLVHHSQEAHAQR